MRTITRRSVLQVLVGYEEPVKQGEILSHFWHFANGGERYSRRLDAVLGGLHRRGEAVARGSHNNQGYVITGDGLGYLTHRRERERRRAA